MLLPNHGYWVFFGSSLVALDDVLPLGVAVEPLGCELELVSVELDAPLLEVAPPEAEPVADFSLSFSASVVAELDELAAPGWLDAPEDGLVALGEVELDELLPALGELGGGVDGVDDALLLLEPGAVDLRSASSPQAARPKAIATATANVESLMLPPG